MKKAKILAATALLFLTACADNAPYRIQSGFFSMDTYMEITAYGSKGETAIASCKDEICRLESLLSVTVPDSDIGRLNSSGTADVSPDTAEIIKYAKQIGEETGGVLDITIYPVLKEWGFTTGDYRIPDEDTLNTLLQKVDFTQIQIEDNTVAVPSGVQLDLGSLAKGCASDKAAEILKQSGIESALINLGGNIMTIGSNPNGSPWRIGIRNPFSIDENVGVLEVADKAVVTSGSYERFFTAEDGQVYHHILDPATGAPARSGLVSATVVGGSGMTCDALSTALFVMGKDRALEYYREKGGFDMILVTESGEIFITEGIADSFTSLTDMPLSICG